MQVSRREVLSDANSFNFFIDKGGTGGLTPSSDVVSGFPLKVNYTIDLKSTRTTYLSIVSISSNILYHQLNILFAF